MSEKENGRLLNMIISEETDKNATKSTINNKFRDFVPLKKDDKNGKEVIIT